MQLLHSATRNYSWGSRTLIPHLQGQPDSEKPVAEPVSYTHLTLPTILLV